MTRTEPAWAVAALVVLLTVVIVASRPGPESSPAQGRTGAPIVGVPTRSTPGPTQRAASRPAPATAPATHAPASSRPSPERSLVAARLTGLLSHMGTAPVGPRYAAIPWGPGIRVTICAKRCITVVSADTGPSLAMQRAGRVADVSVELFVAICGRPASAGLCQGSVETR